MVRGVVSLPHGTGKVVRVLALCTPDAEAAAKEAGADYVGLDEYIEKSLVGWNKKRLSLVSIAVIRLAAYEIMFMDDIPTKVSINEAIELSKKYDDEKAYMLVNGTVNKIAELLSKK